MFSLLNPRDAAWSLISLVVSGLSCGESEITCQTRWFEPVQQLKINAKVFLSVSVTCSLRVSQRAEGRFGMASR